MPNVNVRGRGLVSLPDGMSPDEMRSELQRRFPAQQQQQQQQQQQGFGLRADGTPKGLGFFGVLPRPDGNISTEVSVGVDFGRGETEIPLLVPGLEKFEIDQILSGQRPDRSVLDKAVRHAIGRLDRGLSPFAKKGEQISLPLVTQNQRTAQELTNGINQGGPTGVEQPPRNQGGI